MLGCRKEMKMATNNRHSLFPMHGPQQFTKFNLIPLKLIVP